MDDLIPIFIVGFVMGMICFIAYVVLEVVRSRTASAPPPSCREY